MNWYLIPMMAFGLLYAYHPKLLKKMPAINYWMSGRKYDAKFTPEDVKEVDGFDEQLKGNYKVEIPLFCNVGLDFNATGQMSRYMTKCEVIEHPFVMNLRRGGRWKKHLNEYLWKATWYFSKKPKGGMITATFK